MQYLYQRNAKKIYKIISAVTLAYQIQYKDQLFNNYFPGFWEFRL